MDNQHIQLTEEQLKKDAARQLLELLEEVTASGRLRDAGIYRLDEWLSQADGAGIPAVAFLRDLVKDSLRNRIIVRAKRQELVRAILRIMPDEASEAARLRCGRFTHEEDARSCDVPATPEQLNLMEALHVTYPWDCTCATAAELIEAAVCKRTVLSGKQLMALRFWGREDLAGYGNELARAWLRGWYRADPHRLVAWDLWVKEHPECIAPDNIPVGVGSTYLERVKS